MPDFRKFCKQLTENCQVKAGDTVLCAVSGGADSLALLLMLNEVKKQLQFSLSCVHVEHGIRGEASRLDEAYVQKICQEYQIQFQTFQVDVPGFAKENGMGIEEAARKLRYSCFEKAADAVSADVIALAHHSHDQAETVLMHLLRGCDIDALSGMHWREGKYIRPLLDTEPDTLRAFLVEKGITWREDESNRDNQYTRNRIRNVIFPEIEQIYPGAERSLCHIADSANRDRSYFEEEMENCRLSGSTIFLPGTVVIKASALEELHPALRCRYFVKMIAQTGIISQNREKILAISDMIDRRENTVVNLEGNARAKLWRNLLILAGDREWTPEKILTEETQTAIGNFRVDPVHGSETVFVGDGKCTQSFPVSVADDLFADVVRKGDRFEPFGASHELDAMSFLADVPLCQELRRSIPVLRNADGQILWICGIRPAEAARIEEGRGIRVTFQEGSDIQKMIDWIKNRD